MKRKNNMRVFLLSCSVLCFQAQASEPKEYDFSDGEELGFENLIDDGIDKTTEEKKNTISRESLIDIYKKRANIDCSSDEVNCNLNVKFKKVNVDDDGRLGGIIAKKAQKDPKVFGKAKAAIERAHSNCASLNGGCATTNETVKPVSIDIEGIESESLKENPLVVNAIESAKEVNKRAQKDCQVEECAESDQTGQVKHVKYDKKEIKSEAPKKEVKEYQASETVLNGGCSASTIVTWGDKCFSRLGQDIPNDSEFILEDTMGNFRGETNASCLNGKIVRVENSTCEKIDMPDYVKQEKDIWTIPDSEIDAQQNILDGKCIAPKVVEFQSKKEIRRHMSFFRNLRREIKDCIDYANSTPKEIFGGKREKRERCATWNFFGSSNHTYERFSASAIDGDFCINDDIAKDKFVATSLKIKDANVSLTGAIKDKIKVKDNYGSDEFSFAMTGDVEAKGVKFKIKRSDATTLKLGNITGDRFRLIIKKKVDDALVKVKDFDSKNGLLAIGADNSWININKFNKGRLLVDSFESRVFIKDGLSKNSELDLGGVDTLNIKINGQIDQDLKFIPSEENGNFYKRRMGIMRGMFSHFMSFMKGVKNGKVWSYRDMIDDKNLSSGNGPMNMGMGMMGMGMGMMGMGMGMMGHGHRGGYKTVSKSKQKEYIYLELTDRSFNKNIKLANYKEAVITAKDLKGTVNASNIDSFTIRTNNNNFKVNLDNVSKFRIVMSDGTIFEKDCSDNSSCRDYKPQLN